MILKPSLKMRSSVRVYNYNYVAMFDPQTNPAYSLMLNRGFYYVENVSSIIHL